MTNEQLTCIIEALKVLSEETDTEASTIVEELIGFCWDEEDGYKIERNFVCDEN